MSAGAVAHRSADPSGSPRHPAGGAPFREIVAEAAEWRLIGLLLERPRPGWIEEIDALALEIADPDLLTAAQEARQACEGAYIRLLGPGGNVPAREVGYRAMEDPGRVLADLASFYDAFAYHPRAEDPIDHVAVEAGFVGYLLLKEAYARAGGDEANAATVAEARPRFIEAHLRSFAGPLARRLESSGTAHLARAARRLAARTGDAPDTPRPPLALLQEEGNLSCG